MKLELAPTHSRALRRVLFIVIPALAWYVIIQPYVRAVTAAHERAAELRTLLGRELALLDEANEYPDRLRVREAALRGVSSRLFAGADEIAMTGALGHYVGERAVRSRVLIHRMEMRPLESLGSGLLAIRVELSGVGDLQGLLDLFHSLEGGAKLVRLERLDLTRATQFSVSGASDDEILSMRATVTGYGVDPAAPSVVPAAAPGTARTLSSRGAP